MKTLVIGGTNIDIIGRSKAKLVDRDSNIGDVSVTIGGVAKNIMENLKYLGESVDFLTYVGNDIFAQLLCKPLDDLEIDYKESLFSDRKNNVYLAIHNSDGDMNHGLNDMEDFSLLDPIFLKSKHEYIDGFDVLVLDCNLSKESLDYLINTYKRKKIYVEGVSQAKVIKLLDLLEYVDLLKINNLELKALLNMDICDIIKGVKDLVSMGLETVVVSSGKSPITYNIDDEVFESGVYEAKNIKSTVGAGDALFAGIVFSLNQGRNMHEAIDFAKKIAAKTLETESACNRDISKLI